MSRREQLEQMLQDDPQDIFCNYALGKELQSAQETEAACRQFDRVLELDPNYVPAWFQKGQALAEASRIDEAKDTLKQGIEVAKKVNDQHALQEMMGFLEML